MEKVRAGEPVAIKATIWNAFVDAAQWVKEAQQNTRGTSLKSGVGFGIILVKNAENSARARFTATLEPIAAGAIGRALVLGIVPAK